MENPLLTLLHELYILVLWILVVCVVTTVYRLHFALCVALICTIVCHWQVISEKLSHQKYVYHGKGVYYITKLYNFDTHRKLKL